MCSGSGSADGICLGPQELRCYFISRQEPTDVPRSKSVRRLLFPSWRPMRHLIAQRCLGDTGSGVPLLIYSAFNRVAVETGAMLKPFRNDLYTANGKTIKAFGIAERVRFLLGGYELETNLVVVDGARRPIGLQLFENLSGAS